MWLKAQSRFTSAERLDVEQTAPYHRENGFKNYYHILS